MRNLLRKKMTLRVVLALFVLIIMSVTMMVIGGLVFVFVQLGFIEPFYSNEPLRIQPFFVLILFSILLGTLLAAVVSNRTLKPLRKIIKGFQEVAEGNFSIQIKTDSIPELEDLTTSFNKMVRELNSIETLRSDFIRNFSHEFKTPIVSIRGFAKLLRNENLNEEERNEYIEIIIKESERLADLSTNILNLSKVEAINILTNKCEFSLDEQIRRVIVLMEPRWSEKKITMHLDLDTVTIISEQDLLQQVWMNLLDNAIKFTPDHGRISIKLSKEDTQAFFEITDNGCGMNQQTIAHLFDKFYQGDKSHSSAGNGLGLTIAKQIVELCQGSISASSEVNQGSQFTVKLPLG